jgi:hypothetical protein
MKDMKLIIVAIISVFVLIAVTATYAMPVNVADADESGKDKAAGGCGGDGDCGGGVCTGGEATSVKCDEGNQGTIEIPYLGINVIDTDTKHHWQMPTNQTIVIAVLNWNNPAFNMQFDIGTGTCPHSGETMATESGNTGQLVVRYDDLELGLDETQWFAHTKTINIDELRGETCEYTLQIMLFDCSMCADNFIPVEGSGGCGGCGK